MCGRYVVKNPVTKTSKLVKSAIQVEDNENYNAHPYQKLPVIKKYKNGNTLEALKKIDLNNGPKLHTISMSFNDNLKDEGVIAILNQIPKETSVIAFVECGITDKAGEAIIKWAKLKEVKNLNGIYIEGNSFSIEMEKKFDQLRANNPNLTVLSEWASESFKEMVKKSYN